jgi:hypothetical protein
MRRASKTKEKERKNIRNHARGDKTSAKHGETERLRRGK